MTFISEIKPQKERFLAKYDCYFGDLCVHFETPLGWETAYVCPNIRTEKKAFTVNSQNINQAIDIQVTFITEKKLHKEHF